MSDGGGVCASRVCDAPMCGLRDDEQDNLCMMNGCQGLLLWLQLDSAPAEVRNELRYINNYSPVLDTFESTLSDQKVNCI